MIIIKNVPGISEQDLINSVGYQIGPEGVRTGHGGVVLDERQAHTFLTRYLAAMDYIETGAELPQTGEFEPEEQPAATPKKRGRPRKEPVA